MYLMHNFYIFTTALFASLIMVPAIRKWAMDTGVIDFPGERRAHNRAIARAGGVAIFVPFMFSILVYSEITREMRGVLAGALLIFFTGLADDLYRLTAKQKFVGQVCGCLVTILVGDLYLTNLGNLAGLGKIVLPVWAGGFLALFALVGVINAFNMIDGLDGLAGGLSVVGLIAFSWLALQDGNIPALAIAVALLGSLLGFLKYNAFPARIFMGDTGSLVIGFVLGCLSIMLTQGEGKSVSPVVPLMILSIPIVDTLAVMLQRVLKGQRILGADRSHLHHKIMALGLDHSFTVLLIHVLALSWAIIALVFQQGPEYVLFAGVILGSVLTHAVINVLLRRQEGSSFESRSARSVQINMKESLLRHADDGIDFMMIAIIFSYAFWVVLMSTLKGSMVTAVFCAFLGVAGIVLFLYASGRVNWFCLLVMAPVFLLNYYGEGSHLQYASLMNAVFVVLAILLAIKFVLLKSLDRILDFYFEFILFAMALILAVVPPDLDLRYHLSGVVSKGVLIFLTLKFTVLAGRKKALSLALVLNLSLFTMIIKSFWSS